jgi:hypothetical protein
MSPFASVTLDVEAAELDLLAVGVELLLLHPATMSAAVKAVVIVPSETGRCQDLVDITSPCCAAAERLSTLLWLPVYRRTPLQRRFTCLSITHRIGCGKCDFAPFNECCQGETADA